MLFGVGDYLEPTSRLYELRILTALGIQAEVSQAELARKVGLAPAMVNTYLRRFDDDGLISRIPRGGRRFEYRLTPAGEKRRAYSIITCLAELQGLFEEFVDDLKQRVVRACGPDPCRVVIYGAGEVGRMAYLAIRELPHISLVGVVDDDPAKHGVRFFDHQIESPAAVAGLCPDRVLISSWWYAAGMRHKLRAQLPRDQSIQLVSLTP